MFHLYNAKKVHTLTSELLRTFEVSLSHIDNLYVTCGSYLTGCSFVNLTFEYLYCLVGAEAMHI